jgi:site-specific recombinase XerD
MKNKSAKISTDQLFFSQTWNFLNVYLAKQAGRSQVTAESYRDSLTIFKNYLVGELGKPISTFQFSDCTKECIYNFREYLLANGSQPSTVNVRVAAIRAYLNYASDMDISIQSVALAISQISPCKTIKKEKPVLSDDALAAILSAPPNTKFGVRDRAILILLYDTAVRISELLSIRLCDIAMESKYPNIFITGKGNKERTIQLTAKAVEHLREYIRVYHSNSSKEAYLFSTTIKDRMSVGNVQRIIKKYAALVSESGISLPDSVHCHMFRRTRATNLYQDGIAIELVQRCLNNSEKQCLIFVTGQGGGRRQCGGIVD